MFAAGCHFCKGRCWSLLKIGRCSAEKPGVRSSELNPDHLLAVIGAQDVLKEGDVHIHAWDVLTKEKKTEMQRRAVAFMLARGIGSNNQSKGLLVLHNVLYLNYWSSVRNHRAGSLPPCRHLQLKKQRCFKSYMYVNGAEHRRMGGCIHLYTMWDSRSSPKSVVLTSVEELCCF